MWYNKKLYEEKENEIHSFEEFQTKQVSNLLLWQQESYFGQKKLMKKYILFFFGIEEKNAPKKWFTMANRVGATLLFGNQIHNKYKTLTTKKIVTISTIYFDYKPKIQFYILLSHLKCKFDFFFFV